jgi:hypothetical protein
MSQILKKTLAVGLAFALLISSVGLPSPAQFISAKPEDFIPLEIAAGTLGAVAVPLLSIGILGLTCFREEIESCMENPLKRPLLVVPGLFVLVGPAVGAAAGVIWTGSSLGVRGNILMTFIGGFLGEGVSLLTVGILGSSYVRREAEREALGLELSGAIALFSWLFVAPALSATWGYNLGSEMTLVERQPSSAREGNSAIEVTLFKIEF